MAEPVFSVVVACVESGLSVDAALTALERACAGRSVEIFIVDASTDGTAERAEAHPIVSEVVRHPPGTLVPDLWADGIRRSRGRYVALSTGHCRVPDGWVAELTEALDAGAGAAGAGLVLAPDARMVDRAVYFLRYGAFLDQTCGDSRVVAEVPGDNAAYRGADLREYVAATPGGFWELPYHDRLRERGGEVWAVPAAAAAFGRAFPFRTILEHRWRHGRHHGADRVRRGQTKLRVVLPAALVPVVLFLRAHRRRGHHPGYPWRLLTAAPAFFALAAAWAAGEAVGAVFGASRHPSSPPRSGS